MPEYYTTPFESIRTLADNTTLSALVPHQQRTERCKKMNLKYKHLALIKLNQERRRFRSFAQHVSRTSTARAQQALSCSVTVEYSTSPSLDICSSKSTSVRSVPEFWSLGTCEGPRTLHLLLHDSLHLLPPYSLHLLPYDSLH